MRAPIQFILNHRDVATSSPPGTLVLDFLREERRLTGTKEGCREGDCGACAVLIGTLENGRVCYRPVTSCLMPIAELNGQHLVTIEGLNLDRLSCIQQAIVDEGASQCGFCTPGIVISVTGRLMEQTEPMDLEAMKTALGGHLCRCTGYRSLKACVGALRHLPIGGGRSGVEHLVAEGELPAYFEDIPARLEAMAVSSCAAPAPGAVIIAGGTDLYVQQGDHLPLADIVALGTMPGLRGVAESDTHVTIGPATTFEDLAESAPFRSIVPRVRRYMDDIASVQIRNRATVGGNLINASPIGDVTILLLALETSLSLESDSGGNRSVALADFYLGYKKMDLGKDEMLVSISIRKPHPEARVSWEKVSKRSRLDIASVNSALQIRSDGSTIRSATLTCGGVAATPLTLGATSAYLTGQVLSAATVREAIRIAQTEIDPISDIRGSASYKRLLVRQLIMAHFISLYPELMTMEAILEEH